VYIAEVQIRSGFESDEVLELIDLLTDFWRVNGQTLGREYPLFRRDDSYRLVLMIPAEDPLSAAHDIPYLTKVKLQLAEAGFDQILVTSLVEDSESDGPCSCENCSWLILYTLSGFLETCLRCCDCFRPVTLYQIPWQRTPTGELHDMISSWRTDFQACDDLQMNCQTGEKFALREMSNLDSSLSRRGRNICDWITEGMGEPTYYYLHRYRGRSVASERRRKCPSCSGEWLLPESLHAFDFKCDRCRLLSRTAISIRWNN